MQKQYLWLIVGIALIVLGLYIMSYSVKAEYFVGRSWMEAQNSLLETDYHIGLGFVSVGFTSILVFVWKRISSKKKRRE